MDLIATVKYNKKVAKGLIIDSQKVKPNGRSIHRINALAGRLQNYVKLRLKYGSEDFKEMCRINQQLAFAIYLHNKDY